MAIHGKFFEWFKKYLTPNLADPYKGFQQLINDVGNDPDFGEFLNYFSRDFPQIFNNVWPKYLMDQVGNGSLGYNDVYERLGYYNVSPNEELSKYLDNQIAQQNADVERQYQTGMRDSSLLSAGNQLSQLGLSPSNVISVGGASSGVSTAAAQTSHMQSSANRLQQLRMNQYNQRMGMAKSLISMAGSMASSGIYGASLNAAKHSAAALAAAASHSGINILKHHNGFGNGKMSLPDNLPSNERNFSLESLLGLS